MSIRARLVLGMLLLVSTGLVVSNVCGILLLRSYLLDRADSQVSAISPTGTGRPPVMPNDLCENPRDPQGLRSDFAVLVLGAQGQVICSLGPELGDELPALEGINVASGPTTVTVPSRDRSTRWRVRAIEDTASGQTIVLAVSLSDADATVTRMARLSVLVSTLTLLLTAAASWGIARLGLKPLARIEESAERIAAGDLTERVPTLRRRTEIGRLTHALNGMLSQIERAFTARTESEARLRRFVSDASHELRTPVAAIRGHAEMWRTGITHDLDTVMSRIEAESTRMGDLVDDMLLLARLDQSRPLEHNPVDVLSLATDAILDAQAVQPERDLALDAQPGTTAPVVLGDEGRLRQILANLLTNALVHTPVTSRIRLQVRANDRDVELFLRDAGPGMPPEVASRAFDRFYRADPSRARDHGGSGLGLSIVQSLTEAHHGTVTCSSTIAEGTTFLVRLPMATHV